MRTNGWWSSRIAVAAAFAVVSSAASAQTTFIAHLTNSAEPAGSVTLTNGNAKNTGAPRAQSFGTAIFVLNAAQTQMTMTATIFNIDVTGLQTAFTNDNLTAAHIHVGDPGATTPTFPVRWGFFGTPDNDNNPDQLVVTPMIGGIGGTFTSAWDLLEGNAGTTLTTNLPNIFAGRAYINFHTLENTGGEIRGTLAAVPEPSTYVLMATGLGVLGMLARRRRDA